MSTSPLPPARIGLMKWGFSSAAPAQPRSCEGVLHPLPQSVGLPRMAVDGRPAPGTGRVDVGSGDQVLSHLRELSPHPELTQTSDLGWEERRGGERMAWGSTVY